MALRSKLAGHLSEGRLYVYSGPSGVGKGTLLAPYLKDHPKMVLSCSMTTRSPRPGEIPGVHYDFVTREEFCQALEQGMLLEYVRQYGGDYYGTPRKKVEELLSAGYDVILEIDVYGARQVRKSFPQGVFIFVLPPSMEDLHRRLLRRHTETPEKIEKRLQKAREELCCAGEYDYLILNDDVSEGQRRLAAVLEAAKWERRFMGAYWERMNESNEYAAAFHGIDHGNDGK